MMANSQGINRRRFLRRSVATAAAGLAVPIIISAQALSAPGRPGANDRIGVAYIGAGRRANQLMNLPPEGRIVAVADFDLRRAEAVAATRNCRAYQDYRQMLEAKDIDAVFVATPDHWHVLAGIHACQAGKDVYLEKPLSLTIGEGRAMVEAVRNCGRVLQTGSQRRCMNNHRLGCELVRNGVAGKIHTVIIKNYPSPWESRFPQQSVPKGLNWDAWCGMTDAGSVSRRHLHSTIESRLDLVAALFGRRDDWDWSSRFRSDPMGVGDGPHRSCGSLDGRRQT